MRVVLFGATGMIGSGALIECISHPDVDAVLAVGRRSVPVQNEKVSVLVHEDFFDFSYVSDRLEGYDACFYCLGVSAAGMAEDEYHRITYDMTIAAAEALLAASPGITMCYISGAGADSSEHGRVMWARVKGKIENQLRRMPFAHTWIFRPAFVQPMKGVTSRTKLYNIAYKVLSPFYPVLRRVAPKYVTTTERVGLAMIAAARDGASSSVLENAAIDVLARRELERLGRA